jgi:AcrR family transcriptional regulator
MGISYRQLARSRNLKTDERLGQILRTAARIMAEDGYERATIRKVARAVDGSISSLYYYFKSKEELLFQIQFHTFQTILDNLEGKLSGVDDPQEEVRILIRNHLDHFCRHLKELVVCSHELETLSGKYYKEVRTLRTRYFEVAQEIVTELLRMSGNRSLDARTTALGLFGMLNWIYTWWRPDAGPSERRMANQITNLFLNGVRGERGIKKREPR